MYIPFEAVFPKEPLVGIPSKAPEKISKRNGDAIIVVTVSVHIEKGPSG